MYEEHFGLSARPFDLTSDPRFWVFTTVHQEALSNLQYGIASAKVVTLLVGEAGTGKTTILRAAIDKQPIHTHAVHLENPALTRAEFVQMIAAKFALSDHARKSKTDLLLELEETLRERSAAKQLTVLVIDEAQSVPFDLLEELRLLTNIEIDGGKPLSLVLAGQPELAVRLNEPAWRQLKQRVALRCELRPLSLRETAVYIASRIKVAGGNPAQLFTRDAIVLLHQFARGIPRTINVIADNALLGAFAADIRTVTSHIVLEVCKDFDLTATAEFATTHVAPSSIPRTSNQLSTFEQHVVDSAIPQPTARRTDVDFKVTKRDDPANDKERLSKKSLGTASAPLLGLSSAQK